MEKFFKKKKKDGSFVGFIIRPLGWLLKKSQPLWLLGLARY